VPDARWLSNHLNRLSDSQIRDAFRAANYSPAEIDTYTRTIRRKSTSLIARGPTIRDLPTFNRCETYEV
jgi:hypothetical protein